MSTTAPNNSSINIMALDSTAQFGDLSATQQVAYMKTLGAEAVEAASRCEAKSETAFTASPEARESSQRSGQSISLESNR